MVITLLTDNIVFQSYLTESYIFKFIPLFGGMVELYFF